MTRLLPILASALAALMLAAPAALGALHVVHGPALPPNPRAVPPNTIVVGGSAAPRRTKAAIPPAPRAAGRTDLGPRVAYEAPGKARASAPAIPAPPPLSYHGGYTMTYDLSYPIFWEPRKLQDGTPTRVAPGFNRLAYRYFDDIGGSGLFNINTQYYSSIGGVTAYIENASRAGGYVIDTYPYPAGACRTRETGHDCVSDSQIQAAIHTAIRAARWKPSPYHGFFIYVSKGEGTCVNRACYPGICAYHAYSGHRYGRFIYANVPYQNRCRTRVRGRDLAPHHNSAVDSTIDTTSHEQMEEVTDPYGAGWYGPGGVSDEIADRCVEYGPRPYDGGAANQKLNGNYYIVQMEWDNAAGACTQSGP